MVRSYSVSSEAVLSERARAQAAARPVDFARVLRLEKVDRRALQPDEVRVRVLAVSAEHNIVHAVLADTVDIAKVRGGKTYPGNSFVGEVIEIGTAVRGLAAGDIVAPCGTTAYDAYGYPVRTWGFDDPMPGCYAEEVVLPRRMLFHVSLECGLSFWQIAVLPLRAANAFHLWTRARDLFRAKVPNEREPSLNVLAFGGGVSELFLMLAQSQGHRAFYCAGNTRRREYMDELGITAIDQMRFSRFASPADVNRFRAHVHRATGGLGMHLICDMFRGPIFRAAVAAASREGVVVSAGWQLESEVRYPSDILSLRQITLDHAHISREGSEDEVASLFGSVFRPPMHDEIYSFEDLPRALSELHAGTQSGFAAIRVAASLPRRVRDLLGRFPQQETSPADREPTRSG